MTDGGPAFPVPSGIDSAAILHAQGFSGMSLRQLYMGMALQGLLSNPDYQHACGCGSNPIEAAKDALAYADALLAQEVP